MDGKQYLVVGAGDTLTVCFLYLISLAMNRSATLRMKMAVGRFAWRQLALSAEPADTDGLTVRVRQGALHGACGEGRSFKGVPYAAPPMGPLRWRPPRSAPQWTGVR